MFRRPVGKIKSYPLPRVVQGVDHRRRRRAAKRQSAGAGSGGSTSHQCRYVGLSGITTTVRPPHCSQTARTAAYHWPLCSIGNRAHGGGTAAAKRLTIPTISTDETNASSSYEGIGPHFAQGEGPGRVSRGPVHPKYKLPPPERDRVVQGDNHRRRRGAVKRPSAGAGSGGVSRLYQRTTRTYTPRASSDIL